MQINEEKEQREEMSFTFWTPSSDDYEYPIKIEETNFEQIDRVEGPYDLDIVYITATGDQIIQRIKVDVGYTAFIVSERVKPGDIFMERSEFTLGRLETNRIENSDNYDSVVENKPVELREEEASKPAPQKISDVRFALRFSTQICLHVVIWVCAIAFAMQIVEILKPALILLPIFYVFLFAIIWMERKIFLLSLDKKKLYNAEFEQLPFRTKSIFLTWVGSFWYAYWVLLPVGIGAYVYIFFNPDLNISGALLAVFIMIAAALHIVWLSFVKIVFGHTRGIPIIGAIPLLGAIPWGLVSMVCFLAGAIEFWHQLVHRNTYLFAGM